MLKLPAYSNHWFPHSLSFVINYFSCPRTNVLHTLNQQNGSNGMKLKKK